MDENGRIGVNGKMPWHIPEDLKYFKAMTLYKIVVMGRKTYESIGKHLDNRTNIILSADEDFYPPECIVVRSIKEVFDLLNKMKPSGLPSREIMIIGGASIYKQFLPHADKLYITKVHIESSLSHPSDIEIKETFFPDVDWSLWEEKEQKKVQTKNGDITFSVFLKKFKNFSC